MTLRTIHLTNIKGIGNKLFTLNIIANKPSILYAPNGFGKSSLAIGFDSLNSRRIELNNDDLYQNSENNRPRLELTFEKPDGTITTLLADDNTNTISTEFDCFVIRNQVRAKGKKLRFGGRTNFTASLGVDAVVLIDRIPPDVNLQYSITTVRQNFGTNGKVLSNLTEALNIPAFLEILANGIKDLERLCGTRMQGRINQLKTTLNQQNGNTEQILDWMEANGLATVDSMEPLQILTDLLMPLDLGFTRRAERALVVIQILDLYRNDKNLFKGFLDRKLYEFERRSYVKSFSAFNATWKDIRPKEKEGSLVVEFPKANLISNGQRDILCLISLLERAKRKLKKQFAILIIDEVFDYLDEANLVAAQYYITEFIENFRRSGRSIYPLILTHLNPGLFKNYSFSKMKVYYLDQRTPAAHQPFVTLLQRRDDASIQNDVSQFLLHFHPGQINKRPEFHALGLRETWGEGNNFRNYIDGQLQVYLTDQPGYDPFAVCCAVRRRIEARIYNSIAGTHEKATFLTEHMTNKKLAYAETIGVVVPEYYYLLGIIYNEGMHWKADRDNFSPLAAKLENGVIRTLISDLFT